MSIPTCLRVEHLGDRVLGLGDRRPRLSWILPDGATEQQAYCIEIDGEPADTVRSGDSVLVPWLGGELGCRQRVQWRVKVWTDAGESDWSAPAWFETGLFDPADWVARWIEPNEAGQQAERLDETDGSSMQAPRPAYVLRHRFELEIVPATARLYATAHGIYETFLNGRRVGDVELAPGFTSYDTHLHVQVYDVSDLVVTGTNVWEVVLSDGWYRGRTGYLGLRDGFGQTVAFLGQLHAGDTVLTTGPGWESAVGPIVTADLIDGQYEDHRREPSDWQAVRVVDHDLARLRRSPAPPTRRVEEVRPIAVTRLHPDRHVVDLGQNINGWVRLTDLGSEGTDLLLTHGEAIDASGDVTLEHLAIHDYVNGGTQPVGQVDRVISAGRAGDVFEPRHTTHGFQYVRVEGYPGRLTADDVTGVVVHTDMRRTGWFRCSDERLNRFHDIAEWSFRGNACDIPTDCPQRERSGWTGDWQLFVPTAAFLYDVAGFSLKWLRDVAAQQLADGCIINLVPDPQQRSPSKSEYWQYLQGSSGWGDAIVLVPWELYRAYGDRDVLRELWPAMVAWVDFAAARARTMRHPTRVEQRPEPAPHEAYVWDGGYHWGEWLEPGASDRDHIHADHGAVGTAFLHHSAAILARIGQLLGYDADAERFDELAENALAAWRTEFIGPDGALTPDTQATHVRALAFGLVPDDMSAQTADRLVKLIRDAGTHLGTGFLATPDLLPVLAEAGHLDVAYELLLRDTPPSWLTMVDRGATTVWESWEGIDDDGGAHESLNHYSKGAVISFLHRYVAGIRLLDDAPAYRRFRIEPLPGGALTWAEAVHDSPYGRIESSWRVDDGVFRLTATVPPGTIAEIVMPDGGRVDQGPGTRTHELRMS